MTYIRKLIHVNVTWREIQPVRRTSIISVLELMATVFGGAHATSLSQLALFRY